MTDNAHAIMSEEWSLQNLPPEGHADVGPFFYRLFEDAMFEKERLGLPDRWFENHRLFRGDHWNKNRVSKKSVQNKPVVNLIFANIQRTVANLTARNPIAEVVSIDGIKDGTDQILSQKLRQWWGETEQGVGLSKSGFIMEIYGTVWEKGVPDIRNNCCKAVSIDNYAIFPAPGYYDSVQDLPYICHAYPLSVKEIEAIYRIKGVDHDDTYSLFGEDREDNAPIPSGSRYGTQNSPGNFSSTKHPIANIRDLRQARGLVIEIWVRDFRKCDCAETGAKSKAKSDDVNPQPDIERVGVTKSAAEVDVEINAEEPRPYYPGNIRMVTITNRGRLVCLDAANPNVNPNLPDSKSRLCHLYNNFPFSKACSYEDTASMWGFSAAEQTDDLNLKINEILARIVGYIRMVCLPPLIVPLDTEIKTTKITNRAGLVLRPKNHIVGAGIRFLQVPSLPPDFFRLIDTLLTFFDRIYAIEDVDRGATPKNIQAASAIVTLQERNAVLMRQKIRAIDFMVRERGRWEISFLQNFAWKEENIEVQDVTLTFRGTDLAGRMFNYLVESGSTVAKTDLQKQDQAMELFKAGAIDREALLETVNFDGWRKVVERMGEDQIDQALNILVQAGLPEDQAMMLKQVLSQPQGGPGGTAEGANPQLAQPPGDNGSGGMAPTPQPGMPMAVQGAATVPPGQLQPSVAGV
jgi:hypothetical protein